MIIGLTRNVNWQFKVIDVFVLFVCTTIECDGGSYTIYVLIKIHPKRRKTRIFWSFNFCLLKSWYSFLNEFF